MSQLPVSTISTIDADSRVSFVWKCADVSATRAKMRFKCDYCKDEMPAKYEVTYTLVCELLRKLLTTRVDNFLDSI